MGNRPIQLRPPLALLALAALGCSPGEWRSPLEGRPSRAVWEYARAPVRPRDVVTVAPAALPEPEPIPGSATAGPRSAGPEPRGAPPGPRGATALPRSGTAVSAAPAPPAAAGAAERSLPDLSHDLDDVLADLEAIVEESFAVQKALLRLRMK